MTRAVCGSSHGVSAVRIAYTRARRCPSRVRPTGRAKLSDEGGVVDEKDLGADLAKVLIPESDLQAKVRELAGQIDADYAGKDLLLVGVLKGAVMIMADLARALHTPASMDWMGGLRAAAQAGGGQDRPRREVHRVRHPQRVRHRVRARLCGEVPEPAVRRHTRPARVRRGRSLTVPTGGALHHPRRRPSALNGPQTAAEPPRALVSPRSGAGRRCWSRARARALPRVYGPPREQVTVTNRCKDR